MKSNIIADRLPFYKVIRSEMNNKHKARLVLKEAIGYFSNIPVYIALVCLSLVFLVPFFYMISRSMMTVQDLVNINVRWLPRRLNFENFKYGFIILEYWNTLWRTLYSTALEVFGQIFVCAFIAYGLARIKFRGSRIIFGLILFTLIVPPQTVIVPMYLLFSRIGWINSFLPLIVPCYFGLGLNGGLFIYIFRQFFSNMPKELENAALIDGTGVFGAYFRIMLPNAKPALLVTTILSLIWQWNNFFEPSIYIQDVGKGTLPMQLSTLYQTALQTYHLDNYNDGVQLAATFLTIAPIIVIFLLLQKHFMKSIETSGLAN